MGVGSRVLPDLAHYQRYLTAGHFWMTLLEGEHVSTDVAGGAGPDDVGGATAGARPRQRAPSITG